MILSVDTTSEFGSIALTDASGTVGEMLLHSPDGFGHILFEHLLRLLEKHAIDINAIECFAATSGPGSFTGVRVGLTAVKGLAEAARRPLVAVSNLQALAAFGTGPLRATVLNARRGEVYGAVYDAALKLVQPEITTKFPVWLESLPKHDIEIVTTDFTPFQPFVDASMRVTIAPRALAGAVGRIALQRLQAGQTSDPAEVDANYVRRSDAELLWKDEPPIGRLP